MLAKPANSVKHNNTSNGPSELSKFGTGSEEKLKEVQKIYSSNERGHETKNLERTKNPGGYTSVAGRVAIVAQKPGRGPRASQQKLL